MSLTELARERDEARAELEQLKAANQNAGHLLVEAVHQIKNLVMFGQDFARHHATLCDPATCVRLQKWRETFKE
jgi:hypothetical protein